MMGRAKRGAVYILAVALTIFTLLMLCSCAADVQSNMAGTQTNYPAGYLAVEYQGDGFLAAGTNGRIDKINKEGQVSELGTFTDETLLDICAADGITLICGENGMLLYSDDGQNFEKIDTGETGTISGVAAFNGRYYAGAENGRLLISDDGRKWKAEKTETDEDILAVAASDNCLMAVTAETDIIMSVDGESFEMSNFNSEYEGYYEPRTFGGLVSLGSTLFVFGQIKDNPGEPYVMYTEVADVWIFKLLTDVNGGDFSEQMPITIKTIGISGDQLVAVCDKGRLLTITECAECHQLSDSGTEWNRIAMGGGLAVLVGQDYRVEIMDENSVRQTAIGAEQANTDIQNGAAVIDVRSAEERSEGYIPGSLHIPVDEIGESLPVMVPDKSREIIFYCAAGGRAQTALEQALDLGYETVYNLGGISDWPYEIEKE